METLSDHELEALLDDMESDRVEKKAVLTADGRKRAQEVICAFANDLPNHNKVGVLFIGADDDGTPSGINIDEDLLNSLANIKTDGNVLPPPAMTVQKRTLKGSEMAVVTVAPSTATPVKYDGRIWIRTGARRSIANEQEERVLVEKAHGRNTSFDMAPVPAASLENLSKISFEEEYLPAAFAPDIIAANNRTYEQRLAACNMVVSVQDPTPTVLGVLTLCAQPQNFVYGAYVQFLRLDGTELSDPIIDALEIRGTLKRVVERCEDKLAAHNHQAYDITSAPTHIISATYPLAAVQQILYNAIMHRSYAGGSNAPVRFYWYNDRIEVISPGGPYGDVTVDNFGQAGVTDYRNPNIASVFKDFGFIQQFGVGITAAKSAMQENGNPPPEFDVSQGFVKCILRKGKND